MEPEPEPEPEIPGMGWGSLAQGTVTGDGWGASYSGMGWGSLQAATEHTAAEHIAAAEAAAAAAAATTPYQPEGGFTPGGCIVGAWLEPVNTHYDEYENDTEYEHDAYLQQMYFTAVANGRTVYSHLEGITGLFGQHGTEAYAWQPLDDVTSEQLAQAQAQAALERMQAVYEQLKRGGG